jgi:hypothetical protein
MTAHKLLIICGFIGLAGCGSGDFNYGKVGNLISGSPMHLDAEYVILSMGQVDCGVQNDLWDAPFDTGRRTARLKDKGRELKFADDVSVSDMKQPYVQIRGDFNLATIDVQSDREGPEKESKLVDVKIGVPINHSCFPQPLIMMGVRKGNFTQDYVPQLLFKYNNGWYIDRIVH